MAALLACIFRESVVTTPLQQTRIARVHPVPVRRTLQYRCGQVYCQSRSDTWRVWICRVSLRIEIRWPLVPPMSRAPAGLVDWVCVNIESGHLTISGCHQHGAELQKVPSIHSRPRDGHQQVDFFRPTVIIPTVRYGCCNIGIRHLLSVCTIVLRMTAISGGRWLDIPAADNRGALMAPNPSFPPGGFFFFFASSSRTPKLDREHLGWHASRTSVWVGSSLSCMVVDTNPRCAKVASLLECLKRKDL
ncbi:hypothetical protein LZ30DRAFT_36034 [Colletotrichum cereale]|nr:hypothetical protein LZ30DRAFT_36034 [Colletotrichum cereale]